MSLPGRHDLQRHLLSITEFSVHVCELTDVIRLLHGVNETES